MTIAQGGYHDQRIGLNIQNCTLIAKMSITARPYNATNNTSRYPKDLYMLVCRQKDKLETIPDQIKNLPAGSSYWIDGSPQSLMYPFNRDKYTVYSCKRIARFKPPPVLFTSTAPPPSGETASRPIAVENPTMGSTDNTQFRNLTVKLPCPKTLTFTTPKVGALTTPNIAQNAHLAVGFFYVDGSGEIQTSTQYPFLVGMTATLSYTDA